MTTRGILSHVASMLTPGKSSKQEPAAQSVAWQDSIHWVEHGNRLREAGDSVDAIDAYREAIAAGTYQHRPYLELGTLYRLRGRSWAALESYVRAAVASNPPIMLEELIDLEWFDSKASDDRDYAALRASITDMLLNAAAICNDARLVTAIILPVAARSCERPILQQLLAVLDARGLARYAEFAHLLDATHPEQALELSSADMPTLRSIDAQRQIALR